MNIEDNTRLDASKELGYTVCGRVKEGIQVVDRISRPPTGCAEPFERDVPRLGRRLAACLASAAEQQDSKCRRRESS